MIKEWWRKQENDKRMIICLKLIATSTGQMWYKLCLKINDNSNGLYLIKLKNPQFHTNVNCQMKEQINEEKNKVFLTVEYHQRYGRNDGIRKWPGP